MNRYSKWIAGAIVAIAAVVSCNTKPQEVTPENPGERGSSCRAKNDCGDGLSCIQGLCQEANFDVSPTGKECYLVECTKTSDCCGDKPTEPPAKCREYDDLCLGTIPGCVRDTCLDDSQCNGGVCGGTRRCELTTEICSSNADCTQDYCQFPLGLGGMVQGTCFFSGSNCFEDGDCPTMNTCGVGTCDCNNPTYNPSDPLCSDEDCQDVCTNVCVDELCVEDTSCEDDTECVGALDMCDKGECVECKEDEDCDDALDEDDDEDQCLQGRCVTPCQGDAECGLFQACDDSSGECEFVGCRSDHECILSGAAGGTTDQRLAKCRVEDDIGRCVVACQTDIDCSTTETCESGECVYIGCTDDTDCKTLLGLHNWEITDETPWIPEGQCREVDTGTDF